MSTATSSSSNLTEMLYLLIRNIRSPSDAADSAETDEQTPPRLPTDADGRGAAGQTRTGLPEDVQETVHVASDEVPLPHGIGIGGKVAR